MQLERKLDERAKEIECDLAKKYDEESNLKLKQKQQQIESLRKSLEDAKRKSEQGSMETQGEALEVDLECRLKTQFTHDEIEPVSKGVRGADIIQTVINAQLQSCGKLKIPKVGHKLGCKNSKMINSHQVRILLF